MKKTNLIQQDGRKPNRKSETESESPKTEPVSVYKETGETGNQRNRNRGLQTVVPLHRPEVCQIKSGRGLSTTIRKLSARSTKWTWFGFPRGLEEAGFLVFWFRRFPVLNQIVSGFSVFLFVTNINKNKNSRQGHHSNFEFHGCKRMQGSKIIGKQSKRKRKRERWGPGAPRGPGPPLSFPLSLFLFLFDCFPILLDPCILLQPRNTLNSSDGLVWIVSSV